MKTGVLIYNKDYSVEDSFKRIQEEADKSKRLYGSTVLYDLSSGKITLDSLISLDEIRLLGLEFSKEVK